MVVTVTGSQGARRARLATIGHRLARGAARSLRRVHREQSLMWELWGQAGRATVPAAGPLRWVRALDGNRLAGSHLSAARPTDADDA